MMRVLHYVNQFFGGIGGEDQAGYRPEVRKGPIGPGRLLNQILHDTLGEDASVVATLICGDNFFHEEREDASAAAERILKEIAPDVVIAGPAFLSGRYGIACAEVVKIAQDIGIPALAGMNAENPAGSMYSAQIYISATGPSPASMEPALRSLVSLATKLANGEEIGPAGDEGYLPRGVRKLGYRDEPGYLRAVNMLEMKLEGLAIHSEVPYQPLDKVQSAPPITDMSRATIALATTGGLVRAGNPDRQPQHNSRTFLRIDMEELTDLSPLDFDAYHGGYYNDIANGNPNYILPLSYVRELEEQGQVGAIHPTIYSLAGTSTPVAECRRMGQEIAEDLARAEVDGCLLVAT